MTCFSFQVAGLQDLLVYSVKGLGSLAHLARRDAGIVDPEVRIRWGDGLSNTLHGSACRCLAFSEPTSP